MLYYFRDFIQNTNHKTTKGSGTRNKYETDIRRMLIYFSFRIINRECVFFLNFAFKFDALSRGV